MAVEVVAERARNGQEGYDEEFDPVLRKPEQFIVEDPEILDPNDFETVVDYFRQLQKMLPPDAQLEILKTDTSPVKIDPDPRRTSIFPDGIVTTTRITPHTYRDFIEYDEDSEVYDEDKAPSYTAHIDIFTSYGHIIIPFQSTEERTPENVNIFNDPPRNQKSLNSK